MRWRIWYVVTSPALYERFANRVDIQYSDLQLASLRDFQKLTSLRCEWLMLYPNTHCRKNSDPDMGPGPDMGPLDGIDLEKELQAPRSFDFRTILPKSLMYLCITGMYQLTNDEAETLAKYIQSAHEVLPNLKKVYVEEVTDEHYELIQERYEWTKEGVVIEEGLFKYEETPLSKLTEGIEFGSGY